MAFVEKTEHYADLMRSSLESKVFDGEGSKKMVEVHVDVLSVTDRQKLGTYRIIHGFKISMGGNLSVRYDSTLMRPIIIKVGQDESNFKTNSHASKNWSKDGVRRIESKSEGRGNMKCVWCDEIFGLGYNYLPIDLLTKFQTWRKKRKKIANNALTIFHLNPALIHWVYDREKVTAEGNTEAGYWTSDLMLDATREFLDLFDFLYGESNGKCCCLDEQGKEIRHVAVINLDYSSNHDAMAPDAVKATNFKRGWGSRKTQNKVTKEWLALKPVRGDNEDGSSSMIVGDLGSIEQIPSFGSVQGKLKFGSKQFYVFQPGDPPPHFEKKKKDLKPCDYVGKDKGLEQVLWERGLWIPGMVLRTKDKSDNKEKTATKSNDRRWNEHDLVFVVPQIFAEDGSVTEGAPELYRINNHNLRVTTHNKSGIPEFHADTKSKLDEIVCELLEYKDRPGKEGIPAGKYCCPTKHWYTFKADELTSVPSTEYNIIYGAIKNKSKCWVKVDIVASWNKINNITKEDTNVELNYAEMEFTILAKDPNAENAFNPKSMVQVFNQTSTAKNVKSLIELLIIERGHKLLMSAKFHCECAGQGIEYCFGRVKWWYNKFHRHTSDGLREDSAASFLTNVVTIHHMRKFARKAREYMRVYRATKDWPDVDDILLRTENAVKALKTHRCAMDTDLVFVSDDVEAEVVDYNSQTPVVQ